MTLRFQLVKWKTENLTGWSIYSAARICWLPDLARHGFLWTLLPDSKACGASLANLPHCRCDRSGGNNNSSPINALALVSAMPLIPINKSSIRLSSGCFSIKTKAAAVSWVRRFSNWLLASLASLSTDFGVSTVTVRACNWFLAAAFCLVSAWTRRAKPRKVIFSLQGRVQATNTMRSALLPRCWQW